MSPFLIFSFCSFTSGYATRLADPIVLPVAVYFGISTAAAALLVTAYGIPYAVAQPFLGPLGERLGKDRCIRWCIVGLGLSLVAGALAPNYPLLIASRCLSGLFGAGLSPLIFASLGDRYEMVERQVKIGRLLFAVIGGQTLGSVVSGYVGDAFGWRASLEVAALVGIVASAAAIRWLKVEAAPTRAEMAGRPSALEMYRLVFKNPRTLWLFGAVALENMFFFGLFPYLGQLLVDRTGIPVGDAARHAGLVLGSFGIGGLVYAVFVPVFMRRLELRSMALLGGWLTAASLCSLVFFDVWWLYAIAIGICGLTYFLLHNPMQVQATELAPTARGAAFALFACLLFCGQGFAPIYFGALMHAVGATAAIFISAAGFLVLGHVVARKVVH